VRSAKASTTFEYLSSSIGLPKMRIFLSLSGLVQLSLATQITFAAQYLGYNSPYSFDVNHLDAQTWMTGLPSARNLTSLSIPGTHDTMTNFINGPISQCQNHRLGTQLASGVRFFDIRARLVNNELFIFHGISPTGYSYVDVLTSFFKFLDRNPGEALIMRLREEEASINSSIDFVTAFNRYRFSDPRTAAGSAKHFWIPPTPGPTVVPTLGELRSKILILQNFGTDPAEYGIKWESPLLSIQDMYVIPDLHAGMDAKFEAIKDGLEHAANGTEGAGDGRLYLGHLSGSVYVLPIEAAAGTRDGSVVGMNDRTGEWLKAGNGRTTGVLIIDFPGRELVREILLRN
jgi:1-phosphatidylinositol phosphodiesterase